MTVYVGVVDQCPENGGIKVAEFTDRYGKSFIVIERNGIRYIQQVTLGKTQDGTHTQRRIQQSPESPRETPDGLDS